MSPDFTHFATASDDGSVKLWDLQKLDGRSLINKSRQTYSRPGTIEIEKTKERWYLFERSFVFVCSLPGLING